MISQPSTRIIRVSDIIFRIFQNFIIKINYSSFDKVLFVYVITQRMLTAQHMKVLQQEQPL